MLHLRKGILAARDIHREIDLIANATQMMLTKARQRLWDSRENQILSWNRHIKQKR